jgi:CHASE2 domain-containing sensor protein
MDADRPRLAAALREAPTRWGSTCIGHQGLVSPAITPLLTEKSGAAAPIPSLVLAALAADENRRPLDVDSEANRIRLVDAGGQRVIPVDVSWVEEARTPGNCPIIEVGDQVAFLVVDPTPLPVLREPSRRLAFEDLLPPDRAIVRAPDLTGKIVLVGEEAEGDTLSIQRGLSAESRYGFEVQADALNTLLLGVVIRPLAPAAQLIVTLLLSLTAGLLRSPALDGRTIARRSMLAATIVAYLAVGVYAYVASRLMVNTVYHLAALFLTYAVLGKLRKWWVL